MAEQEEAGPGGEDYAAARAHALRTMFPRRVAEVPAPPVAPGPAVDTAAAGERAPVPAEKSKRGQTWAALVAGAALLLAAAAAVFLIAEAVERDGERPDVEVGVVVPPATGYAPAAPVTPSASAPAVPSASPSATPAASTPAGPAADATGPAAGAAGPGAGAAGPAPSAPPNAGGANLALGRPVSVSGVEGHPWKAANAVDGDETTRWSSAFEETGWLIVDLGAAVPISEVEILWEHAYAITYRVEASSDQKKWTSMFATAAGAGGRVTVREAAVARYVRLFCLERNSQYGYSVLELRVR